MERWVHPTEPQGACREYLNPRPPGGLTFRGTPRTLGRMCPHCGRDAPLVYRGALAFCSACNRPRVPLSATGVNLAGKPARFGGTVARVVGWVVLAVTLALALIVGTVLQAVFPPGAVVGWAVGGVIAVLGVAAAVVLLMGGRFLQKTGDRAALGARREALFALAQNQGGILRAPLVGKALGVPPLEAEAMLTALSRDPDSAVTLEVDAEGKLFYRFTDLAPELPGRRRVLRTPPRPPLRPSGSSPRGGCAWRGPSSRSRCPSRTRLKPLPGRPRPARRERACRPHVCRAHRQ